MNNASSYFLLTIGDRSDAPIKYWTQEEAFDHIFRNMDIAKTCPYLEITADDGRVLFNRNEIINIVVSRKLMRVLHPFSIIIFFVAIAARNHPWSSYLFALSLFLFIASFFSTAKLVATGNRSLLRRLFQK